MELFSLDNFSYFYPDCENAALDKINLTVESGEFITVCGLSGSGKSTLLSCLKGCAAGRKSGSISVFGKPADKSLYPDKIGFVTQSPDAQTVTDKVWHELAFGAESIGMSPQDIRSATAQLSLFFGIEDLLDKKPSELSGGQKQIVNLASVMIMKPRVLLLDEPLSQLDPIAADEFIGLLARINKELGTAIIVAEHNLSGLMSVCGRMILTDSGKIISDTAPNKLAAVLKGKNHPMLLSMPAGIQLCAAVGKNGYPLNIIGYAKIYREYAEHNTLHIPHEAEAVQSKSNAVKLKDICFKYGGAPPVLNMLSAEIKQGEAFFIMGGNAAGKTTLLKLISGIEKPLSGSVEVNGRIAYLPQNPEALFCKNTVIEDIYDSADNNRDISEIIKICRLENLLYRHPYDLSGGEKQRAALAKLMCINADILLLDEPTKGMDKESRDRLSDILGCIKGKKTVITVSHDADFCAENADRCALLFAGEITFCGKPKDFFSGSLFFTTEAARIAGGVCGDVFTTSGLIFSCTGQAPKKNKPAPGLPVQKNKAALAPQMPAKKKKSLFRKICTATGIMLTAVMLILLSGIFPPLLQSKPFYLPYLLLCIPIALLFIGIAPKNSMAKSTAQKTKPAPAELAAALITLTAVPITAVIGITLLDNRKYLFISLLILAECFIPFMLLFERKRPSAKELATLSVMCAAAVASRELFFMLPQFKPVAALVIISGIAFGAQSGFIVGAVSMLVSDLLFGQGPWTPWQMLAMGLLGFFAGLIFHRKRSAAAVSIYGFLAVLVIYGGIMNLSQVFIYNESPNKEIILSYLLSGLPFDLIHSAATAVFILLGGTVLLEKLERARIKYGLFL